LRRQRYRRTRERTALRKQEDKELSAFTAADEQRLALAAVAPSWSEAPHRACSIASRGFPLRVFDLAFNSLPMANKVCSLKSMGNQRIAHMLGSYLRLWKWLSKPTPATTSMAVMSPKADPPKLRHEICWRANRHLCQPWGLNVQVIRGRWVNMLKSAFPAKEKENRVMLKQGEICVIWLSNVPGGSSEVPGVERDAKMTLICDINLNSFEKKLTVHEMSFAALHDLQIFARCPADGQLLQELPRPVPIISEKDLTEWDFMAAIDQTKRWECAITHAVFDNRMVGALLPRRIEIELITDRLFQRWDPAADGEGRAAEGLAWEEWMNEQVNCAAEDDEEKEASEGSSDHGDPAASSSDSDADPPPAAPAADPAAAAPPDAAPHAGVRAGAAPRPRAGVRAGAAPHAGVDDADEKDDGNGEDQGELVCSLDVEGGVIEYWSGGWFLATCLTHDPDLRSGRPCSKRRRSTEGRKLATGRPLGFLFAWIRDAGHWDCLGEHTRDNTLKRPARVRAREILKGLVGSGPLLLYERGTRVGEAEEPRNFS
jgi:hypothetical protein